MAGRKTEDKYWSDRQDQLYKALEKDENRLNKNLERLYQRELKSLEREIAQYYAEYGVEGVMEYRTLMQELPAADKRLLIESVEEFVEEYPELAHLAPVRTSIYKLNRLEGLQASIELQQARIGAVEQEEIKRHLEKYAQENYAAAMGFGEAFNAVNPGQAAIIASEGWANGESFSDRIWRNKKKFANYIKTDFASAIVRGDGYDRIIADMRRRFGTEAYETRRLVWTEGTYVSTEASMRAFEAAGFTEYKFLTEEDEKVCKHCRPIDGEIFRLADRTPGVNQPPIHPNCRCRYEIVAEREAEQNED